MGDVVRFPPKRVEGGTAIRDESGHASVVLTDDGRVQWVEDLDEASRAFWGKVEEEVHRRWMDTDIPRLRAQNRLMASILEEYLPDWKDLARARATRSQRPSG